MPAPPHPAIVSTSASNDAALMDSSSGLQGERACLGLLTVPVADRRQCPQCPARDVVPNVAPAAFCVAPRGCASPGVCGPAHLPGARTGSGDLEIGGP